MSVGAKLLLVAEVPLAEHAGGIAGVLEQTGLRGLASRQAGFLLAGEDRSFQADALLPAAGHQGCPRGRADRAIGVEVRQADAARSDPVDVRRSDILAAVAA